MSSKNQVTASRVLRRTALALALGACLSSGAVFAQSRTAGSIFGNAAPGTQITIISQDTGLTRTLTVDARGRYSAAELPPGTYSVSASNNGKTLGTRNNVAVITGGNEVDFMGSANAQQLSAMTVTASSLPSIDVSTAVPQTRLTATMLDQLPVARDITQAAILAPGVITADSRYNNSVSFGGAAASENGYYINGYPVTNALTSIGSTTLPFDAIQTEEISSSGYDARYGRSTGGVINIITKSGSNTWKFGGQVIYTPESLRSDRKSIYYEKDNEATNAGTIYRDRSDFEDSPITYGAYFSGPLIKDRLFIYATGEWTNNDTESNGNIKQAPNTNFTKNKIRSPRWLTKIDWNINNSNILEFTGFSDKVGQNRTYYAYDYDTRSRGASSGQSYRFKDGGETYIGKYTGYLTDNLTLTAMYGEQNIVHYAAPGGYDPSQTYVRDQRPGGTVTGLQPYINIDDPAAFDKTDGYRIDLDWRLGSHDLSFGYDVSNVKSRVGKIMSGDGFAWFYKHTDTGDIPTSGGLTTAPDSDYADQYIYENGGQFKVKQKAYYIQDAWQITDRWMVKLGLRNSSFNNYNSDGVSYAKKDNQWAPRLDVVWDVNGDSSLKLYANAGRYFLAMPTNVAVRGAAGSTYTDQYFTFTGIDPVTGTPQGLVSLGPPYSANNEFGEAPDPQTVAAQNLKSHYQDEFIVGMQQQLGSAWNWGVQLQYRDLKSAIDDICDNRPAIKYAEENNIQLTGPIPVDCRLFNPGEDNVLLLDLPDGIDGNLVPVPYNKSDYGMDLTRRYVSVNFSLEHPFDGTWYAKVNYTWSHNYGNDEGQLDSDIGQGDVSQTVLFDHKELMDYGSGDLPNDRRHVLKAYGFYQFTPEWRVGGVLVAMTGRPKSCLGYVPTDSKSYSEFWNNNLNYGRYYHYCAGQPVPRGSEGRLPTDVQVSLNAAYTPAWADGNLKFQIDVLNVFDRQVKQNIEERGELGGLNVVSDARNRVISYDAPRAVRLSARYDFSL